MNPASTRALPNPPSWKFAALALLMAVLATLGLNFNVVRFTVHIWASNETYTHGFLITPISAWLIWRKRGILARMSPAPELRGLIIILFLNLVWQLGHQADVMVVQQYCMVGMLIAAAWTLLGTTVFKQIAFPLFFLLLAVPIGEALIPSLMDFTADFTVGALQWTGIPVYKEGTFFSLPDGNWSVIDACSGLRYLISSLTLGILYAHLTYRSLYRKLVFIAFSAVVPILANGMRAYMIVMIGHLSGMRLATGIDHLIYGWIFFGLVMLLLFWIGAFFKENETILQTDELPQADQAPKAASAPLVPALFIIAIISASGIYAMLLDRKLQTPSPITLDMPAVSGWQEISGQPVLNWTPHYLGSKESFTRSYGKDAKEVSLFIGYYRNQHQGAELITSGNILVKIADQRWGNVGESGHTISIGNEHFNIREARLRSPQGRLLAWEWYWVDGRWTTNHYMAKFLEAKSRLLNGTDDAAVIVVFTPYSNSSSEASGTLDSFLTQTLPGIEHMLANAVRQN